MRQNLAAAKKLNIAVTKLEENLSKIVNKNRSNCNKTSEIWSHAESRSEK